MRLPHHLPHLPHLLVVASWASHLRGWDRWLALSSSDRTRRLYRYLMLRFMADTFLEPNSVTRHEVVEYLAGLPAKGAMRGQMIRALNSYFSWAENEEVCVSPMTGIQSKRRKYGPAPSLSEEEVFRLFLAGWVRSPKRGWVILFAYATGGRRESLAALKPRDVSETRVVFRETKGDSPYSVPLGELGSLAGRELLRIAREEETDTLIGCSAGRIWQYVHDAALDSGVAAWPHLLRHTFGQTIYDKTHDPLVLKEMLGHADLSQVPRYAAAREDRIKEAAI